MGESLCPSPASVGVKHVTRYFMTPSPSAQAAPECSARNPRDTPDAQNSPELRSPRSPAEPLQPPRRRAALPRHESAQLQKNIAHARAPVGGGAVDEASGGVGRALQARAQQRFDVVVEDDVVVVVVELRTRKPPAKPATRATTTERSTMITVVC